MPLHRKRFASSAAGGASPISTVRSPAANEEFSTIFGRTCACRKYFDPRAGGAHTSDAVGSPQKHGFCGERRKKRSAVRFRRRRKRIKRSFFRRGGRGGRGESGEAPPAADEANRFRGSGAIGGPNRAGNRNAATVQACSPSKSLTTRLSLFRWAAPIPATGWRTRSWSRPAHWW